MNKAGKILGLLTLAFGAYGFTRLMRTGNKLSINIANVNKPTTASGALVLSVNVTVDNPTGNAISIKKPYLTAFYNGNEVGNSIPSEERLEIKANDRTTIKGITLQVPFVKLGAMAVSLITGNVPQMSFDISVLTEVNGIPYTNKQHFDL